MAVVVAVVVAVAVIWEAASVAGVVTWAAASAAVMSPADLEECTWAAPARLAPTMASAGCAAATTPAPSSAVASGPARNSVLMAGVVGADLTTTVTTTAAPTTRPITGQIHGAVTGEPYSSGFQRSPITDQAEGVAGSSSGERNLGKDISFEVFQPQRDRPSIPLGRTS